MSTLSKLTGRDSRRRKTLEKQKAEDAKIGGNPGSQMAKQPLEETQRGAGYDQQATADRGAYTASLEGGQQALNASIQAAMAAAMPDLFRTLQQTKETNISRGMYNGETPTSYEGDVMSAFQKNIANAAGSQALGVWNTQQQGREHLFDVSTGLGERSRERYLDLLTGALDRKTAKQNSKRDMWGNIISGGGQLAIAGASLA